MPSEVEHLRREVRDLRYVTEAVLMNLVGKDKMLMWSMEAGVQASIRREDRGTPLAAVGIRGRTLHRLTSRHWDGEDIRTVEELVTRWNRSETAAMEGIGHKTLERIDAVIADKSLFMEEWTREKVV